MTRLHPDLPQGQRLRLPLQADTGPRMVAVLSLMVEVLDDICARPAMDWTHEEQDFFLLFGGEAATYEPLIARIRTHWGHQAQALMGEGAAP